MARDLRRGEVRWYRFQHPDKRRPVLILTRQSSLSFLTDLTVAPITTRIRNVPSEVLLTPDDGMPRACAANLHQIRTVPRARIGKLVTRLSGERMARVREAALFALGLDEA